MAEKQNLSTEVYFQLKQIILHFNLKPGEKINKHALMVLLGVSSTPVRHAILRLQTEGLVTIVPKSGSYVSLIDLVVFQQIAFIQTSLTQATTPPMTQQFDQTSLVELQNVIAKQQASLYLADYDEYFRLEDGIHALLFRIAGYPQIWHWLQTLELQIQRVRFLRLEFVDLNWHQMLTANETLVQAMLEKNEPAVRQLLNRKIDTMLEDLELAQKMHPEYFVTT